MRMFTVNLLFILNPSNLIRDDLHNVFDLILFKMKTFSSNWMNWTTTHEVSAV